MDNALEVRVVNAGADPAKELEPGVERQSMSVAVLRDREPVTGLHHEVGASVLRFASVEDFRDDVVIEESERLTLAFEARQNGFRLQSRADQLHRHASLHRLGLLGQADDTHAALAEHGEHLVRTDALDRRLLRGSALVRRRRVDERSGEDGLVALRRIAIMLWLVAFEHCELTRDQRLESRKEVLVLGGRTHATLAPVAKILRSEGDEDPGLFFAEKCIGHNPVPRIRAPGKSPPGTYPWLAHAEADRSVPLP